MKPAVHVPWFNPREMDDETVLMLNTGREELLAQLFKAVRERLVHPGISSHWLLTGTRGAGKSFFLRLVQASFAQAVGPQARFVLLPEEHRNIYAPHEFLGEIQRMLDASQGASGASPAWRVADAGAAWESALQLLLAAFPETLLVIGVENFDQLLEQAFSDETDSARLRHLMSNEPRLMLCATAVQGDFDENYNQRLFRQFEHHPIPRWDATDHRDYLERRARRCNKHPTTRQLARIDAYSRYTGGNARAAAVLAGAILDDADPLQAATDLDATIEKMSDYYRNLIDRIPPNTRKLFDALVRGGEPASQTEIAERTGARQNDISRAFMWLVDQGYVGESRLPGQKTKQYRVLDRLFVQFYRMRSINPGQRSRLAMMAELLADTLAFQDKWRFANQYEGDGQEPEARTLVELALKERMIDISLLPATVSDTKTLCEIGTGWAEWDRILEKTNDQDIFQEIFRCYPNDKELQRAIEQSSALVCAIGSNNLQGAELVALIENSLSLCPAQKFYILLLLLSAQSGKRQWDELQRMLNKKSIKYKTLENVEADQIPRFQTQQKLGSPYAHTASLDDLSGGVIRKQGAMDGISLGTAVKPETRASMSSQDAKHMENVSESLNSRLIKLQKSLTLNPDSSSLFIAVTDLIKSNPANFPLEQQAAVLEFKGFSFEQTGQPLKAYQTYATAHAMRLETKAPHLATWDLEGMARCQLEMGNFQYALEKQNQAYGERVTQGGQYAAAWNLGQMARITAGQFGLDSAWALLDAEIAKVGDGAVDAIRQLGDAVHDKVREQGEAAAFALGCDLLQGLAARPQYPAETALRGLWIDMIDMAVPHGLLRDLLGEWRCLFGERYDAGLQSLEQLLRDWLDDLDTPPAKREARRLTLDPDLATTFAALGNGLSPQARRRLSLLAAEEAA